jgi:flagellar biosynthetic protein FliQ
MGPEAVLTFGRQGLEVLLAVAAPVLLVALGVGLVVSVLQALTQINEATLSFLPKLVAIAVTLMLAGPWMLSLLVDYVQRVLTGIPAAISGGALP